MRRDGEHLAKVAANPERPSMAVSGQLPSWAGMIHTGERHRGSAALKVRTSTSARIFFLWFCARQAQFVYCLGSGLVSAELGRRMSYDFTEAGGAVGPPSVQNSCTAFMIIAFEDDAHGRHFADASP